MPGRLRDDIKQTKPFASIEVEAHLNLLRSADTHAREVSALFKTYELTPTQYNVLRILRGAGEPGLPCSEIAARLITHDPDVTRLIDKLERRNLVARTRDARDRRVVTVRATAAGVALAGDPALDAALVDLHRRQFAALSADELVTFIALLERARAR
ncbi:MAG: MarR family transcriptional regulator [Planctomycetes bacterium]|nr:MarR family transcriptional regulator [Planctomycetota bacterium]